MQNFPSTTIRETVKFLEAGLISEIFEFLKTGKGMNRKVSEYMIAYTEVQTEAIRGDSNCEELLQYYTQLIENYIIECKNNLFEESKSNQSNLIDEFLSYTKKINFLIYWMFRIFWFLDRFYTRRPGRKTLGQIGMNLYKSNFYEAFKDNIQDEISNLKNEEKNGNEKSIEKLKNIMKILEYLDLEKPKIIKENNLLIWENE